ncbi:argR, partial [Symbiodinium microadriaticum]
VTVDYIRANIAESLKTEELADQVGLSVTQLDRRMRRVFRLSTKKFVMKYRLDLASQLLVSTEKSLSDIALECGFSDQSAFTRHFGAAANLTPLAYRKSHQQVNLMAISTHDDQATNRPEFDIVAQEAIALAADILRASTARETAADKANLAKVAGLIEDQDGKELTVAMADQVLRIKNPRRSANHLKSLVKEYGLPKYFSPIDRGLLQLGVWAAQIAPRLVMPLIRKRIQADSSHVIISAEKEPFARYLAQRKRDGIRINLNQLGEAVLGETEAQRRLDAYLARLQDPEIRYVSVKLSSVAAHISLTGYEATLIDLKERLRMLYRAAKNAENGKQKFVNLDMEEYRDLYLT